MHTRHCLKLSSRIHTLLERELGQGIDAQRLLKEPLYARDVLLVCEAMVHTDGPVLARAFRRAAATPEDTPAAGPGRLSRWAAWLGLIAAPVHALSKRNNSAPSAT